MAIPVAETRLIAVFTVLASLFAATTLLARWYSNERLARAQAYFQAGRRLEAAGRTEQAMENFRNALEISPSGNYRLALAQTLMESDRMAEAAAYLEELVREDAANAEPNLMLARIAAHAGQTQAAIDYYQRAIYGRWTTDAQSSRLAASWELADYLEKSHLEKQFIAQLLDIAEQTPDDEAVHMRVGERLLAHGASHQAVETFHDVLRTHPRDPDAQTGLAKAELALGQYADALAAFRKARREGETGESLREGMDLASEVLALDPNLQGLDSAERYRRSLALVRRAASAAQPFASQACGNGSDLAQRLSDAEKTSSEHTRPREYADATAADLRLAQQLWTLSAPCHPHDDALARVMARLIK